jgi:hypothetical protein
MRIDSGRCAMKDPKIISYRGSRSVNNRQRLERALKKLLAGAPAFGTDSFKESTTSLSPLLRRTAK